MTEALHADPFALLAIALAMSMGGILKGATGAGAPIIAVPLMTAIYDVRVAVAVMVLPSLLTNIYQTHRYRDHEVVPRFAVTMEIWAALGAASGSLFLVWLSASVLQVFMAVIILAYIFLRSQSQA